MTAAQREALPRYARYFIQKLEADLAYARKRAAVIDGNAPTTTVLGYYGDHPIYLPDDTIAFVSTTGAGDVLVSRERHNPQRIRVAATRTRLLIAPGAGNVIEVWAGD